MQLPIVVLVFVIICILQTLYLLLLTIAIGGYKQKSSRDGNPVSVIIAARNAVEQLKILIPQLLQQQYEEFEIVIVDDRSGDETFDYLKEMSAAHQQLKVVTVSHTPDNMNSKKYALTLGIKAAKFDTILLTDADCAPLSPLWIKSMAGNFSDKQIQFNLGVSVYEKLPGLLNAFIRFEALWTAIQSIGFALLKMPYMGVGRNLAYRKSIFLNNKGFNQHISITGGDDDLLVNSLANTKNTAVQLGADSLVYSTPKTNWPDFFTQKLRHLSVGKHYKFKHRLILGFFALSHLLFWAVAIALAVLQMEPYILLGGLVIRTLAIYVSFIVSCNKFGMRFNHWGLVFLDFIFVFYYLSIGIRALFTKRVRWN